MTPRRILIAGWVVLVLYAYPGFMSYDSILQLLQARDGVYVGGHPPMMGVLWRITDALIAGPLPMLLIQISCFLAGAYLLLVRCMNPRAAAIGAVALAWFPPISAVLGVIWKDSQMTAYLMLGTPLLLSTSRRVRVAGLGLMFLATAMRYNAAAVTLPLVVLLFEWTPGLRWWRRYAISLAAWAGITAATSMLNAQLVSDDTALWADSVAPFDITGTLRYAPDLPDEVLRRDFAGTPLLVDTAIQAFTRTTPTTSDMPVREVLSFGSGTYVPALWVTTRHLFAVPETDAQRAAIGRAWRTILLAHPAAYLRYRWEVLRERLHFTGEVPGAAYIWFNDAINIEESMARTEHHAVQSKLQKQLHAAMLWLGTSSLFRPWIYLVLLVIAGVLVARTRLLVAVALSGLANEAALFAFAVTIDYRYSVWLVATALVLTIVAIRRVIERVRISR